MTAAKKVESAKVSKAPGTLVLHLSNGEKIETTPEHLFVARGLGFILAGRLAIGNSIVTRAGPSSGISAIQMGGGKETLGNYILDA